MGTKINVRAGSVNDLFNQNSQKVFLKKELFFAPTYFNIIVETFRKHSSSNNRLCGLAGKKCGFSKNNNFVKVVFHEFTAVIIIAAFYKYCINTFIIL